MAISPMSRGDSPLGRPVQLLTISAWPLVIPSGRARETIRHHEASCRPVPDPLGPAVSRPAALARLSVTTRRAAVQFQIHSARPYPGRPRSRDYPSPRGELPSNPDPISPAVSRPAALARLSVTPRRTTIPFKNKSHCI